MPQAHVSATEHGADEAALPLSAQGAFLRHPCAPAAAMEPAAHGASGTEQQVVWILHDFHAILGERKQTLRAMHETQVRTLLLVI